MLQQTWIDSQIWPQHVQAVLQSLRQRHWLQKGQSDAPLTNYFYFYLIYITFIVIFSQTPGLLILGTVH